MSVLTPKTAGYVGLSYCVATVQADLDDYTDRLAEKMTQLAIRCYTNLNVMRSFTLESDYFEMDENGIIDISAISDLIDVVRLAIPVNGQAWNISDNPYIIPRRDALDTDQADLIYRTSDEGDIVLNGLYLTPTSSGYFGLSGGRNYGCHVDYELMQIQFDTSVPRSQVLVEYRSTGVKASGITLIPRFLVEYIVAFIHWKLVEHNPLADRFLRRDKKEEFIEQEAMLQKYVNQFNLDDYYNMYYGSLKQTPKR